MAVAASAAIACAAVGFWWYRWVWFSDYTERFGGAWTPELWQRLVADTEPLYRHIYAPRALAYEDDCGDNKTVSEDEGEQLDIELACGRVEGVQFVLWAAPGAASIFDSVLVAFCIVQARLNLEDDKGVIRLVQQFLALLTLVVGAMVASFWYFVGAASMLSSAFFAFSVVSLVGLLIFIRTEVPWSVVIRLSESSLILRYCVKGYHSDLVRAVTLLAWGPAVPAYLLLDMLQQQVRRLRGCADSDGVLTSGGEAIAAELRSWCWNSIFSKLCLVVILLVTLFLGGKATFVFFSWLNAALEPLPLAAVVALIACVGLVMYMLPPVPGSAVTVFAAVVIGGKGLEPLGFWAAGTLAASVAFAMKLLGSCGQYLVGYRLGQDLRVQRFVSVDTVPTRAIEKTLTMPGFNVGKLAILVGGPDWPTSVTCGLVRMNIFRMLIGTLPVFPLSIFPQTLVAALLVVETSENPKFWSQVTLVCTIVASATKTLTWLTAVHYITRTIDRDHSELSKPRPEHAQVAELSRREAAFDEALRRVSDWRKATILSASGAMISVLLLMGLDFLSSEPVAFRKFDLKDRIGDSFQDGGLDGNGMNVIVVPLGVVTLVVFALGIAVFLAHSWDLRRQARLLAEVPKE